MIGRPQFLQLRTVAMGWSFIRKNRFGYPGNA